MISKALVTGAYQKKLEELARLPDISVRAVVPPYWEENRVGRLELERQFTEGYELVTLPMRFNGRHHVHHYPALAAQFREFRPDVVHIDEEPYNLVTAQASRLARRHGARALFLAWQNLYRSYPPPFRWIERYCYETASFGLAGNIDAGKILRRKGFRKPIAVIPQFGVDPSIYRPISGPQRHGDSFVIGFVGRVVLEKGVDTLVEALALLSERHRLRIIGGGDYQPALALLANRLGVAGRVTFQPSVPATDVPALLAELDLLVLPSRTRPNWKEQFGRVLVEAMACEVPVIGSDSGEIPNVIGDAGLVFPEGDPAELAARIASLSSDRAFAERLGTAGRRRVLDRFTQEQVAARTYRVYQRMLEMD
jgi:glycosyltransferase involved in cell wall biosynthesis